MSNQFAFKQNVFKQFANGDFYRASSKNFPVLKGLAVQALELEAHAVREPHTHPNAHQLDFCVSGVAASALSARRGRRIILISSPVISRSCRRAISTGLKILEKNG